MTQTITVVFTNHKLEQIVANSMKKYIFNYAGFLDLHIGDTITDDRYDQPMQIVSITPGATFKTPMGHEVKYLIISKWISKSTRFSKKSEVESRTFTLDINTARQWYLGNDESLQKIALQVYKEEELIDITSLVNKSSVCINIPDSVSSDKYHILAELEAYAEYFNSKSKEKEMRYFLSSRPNRIVGYKSSTCIYNIVIMGHSSVRYAGIVYFNSIEDLQKTVGIMGSRLTGLFK